MLLAERESKNQGELTINISITVVGIKLDDGTLLLRTFRHEKTTNKHNPQLILTGKRLFLPLSLHNTSPTFTIFHYCVYLLAEETPKLNVVIPSS